MTLAMNKKGGQKSKLNVFFIMRELSSICSAVFGLHKASASEGGADTPRMVDGWAGQRWDLGAAAHERCPRILWPLLSPGTAGAGLHGPAQGEPP